MAEEYDEEEWREIEGWPYQVSNYGRIKRVGPGRSQVILKGMGKKHLWVVLQDKPRIQTVAVHRIVADAFLGLPPDAHYLDYRDGNILNNAASNLHYCPLYKEDEEWRKVVDWPYEVSSLGRLRRITKDPYYPPIYLAPHSAPHMSVVFTGDGDGRRKTHQVHQVVAVAFHGECPPGLVVDHGDGRPINNVPGNLEYVTRAENNKRAGDMGLLAWGERHANAKLSADEVRSIRSRYAAGGESHATLAREFKVSQGHVCNIVRRLTWRHLDEHEADADIRRRDV